MFEPGKLLENIRRKTPCIHCITNYVTVNDCANILLASGARPNMADDPAEMEEITGLSQGLLLNIGTLSFRTLDSMLIAGRTASKMGLNIVLDPVGAGASGMRLGALHKILDAISVSVIRGNASEIRALYGIDGRSCGVDVCPEDEIDENNLDKAVKMAQELALQHDCVVAISGRLDVIADAHHAFVVKNGHELMPSITGCGCMLSCLTAAFVSANPECRLEATVASFCAMGLAGELAFKDYRKLGYGNATCRNRLIDNIFLMDAEQLDRESKYENIK